MFDINQECGHSHEGNAIEWSYIEDGIVKFKFYKCHFGNSGEGVGRTKMEAGSSIDQLGTTGVIQMKHDKNIK